MQVPQWNCGFLPAPPTRRLGASNDWETIGAAGTPRDSCRILIWHGGQRLLRRFGKSSKSLWSNVTTSSLRCSTDTQLSHMQRRFFATGKWRPRSSWHVEEMKSSTGRTSKRGSTSPLSLPTGESLSTGAITTSCASRSMRGLRDEHAQRDSALLRHFNSCRKAPPLIWTLR